MSVVLGTHTQGLQLVDGGFNMDKWHIKAGRPVMATTWGCLLVVFSSFCLLQPLFLCMDTCQTLSFVSCPLLPSWTQSYGSHCSSAFSLRPLWKSMVLVGLRPLPVS